LILLQINNPFLTNIERIAAIVVLFVVKEKANDVLMKHLNANYREITKIMATAEKTWNAVCALIWNRRIRPKLFAIASKMNPYVELMALLMRMNAN
jgi:hypothetical protein